MMTMEVQFYLNQLINIIINLYFNESRCIYILTDATSNYEYSAKIPILNINLEDEMFNIDEALKFGCQEFVVHVENTTFALETIETNINSAIQRFNERKYIFALTNSNCNGYNTLMEMLNSTAIRHISDILLIVNECNDVARSENHKSKKGLLYYTTYEMEIIFQLFTHKYIGLTDNNHPQLLDRWFSRNCSFSQNSNLFPDKITNQQGRILKYGTFTYPPYSIVGPSLETSDGTEFKFALEFAIRHNCTIELLVDQEALWGEIYDNKTGIGVLGNLAEDKVDLSFVALYTWYHEFKFLDLSAPIIRTGITCLTPAPRRASGWLVAFFPFSTSMWIAVLGAFILSIVTFYYTTRTSLNLQMDEEHRKCPSIRNEPKDKNLLQNIIMHIYGLFLLQGLSDNRLTVGEALRILLTSLLIFCLLLSCSYGSGLASSMTVPRFETAIETVNDLADSDIKWAATHEAWIFSILEDLRPNIIKIRNKFQIKAEQVQQRLLRSRKYGFALERLPGGHFAIGDYVKEDDVRELVIMKEDIYWEQCVFMGRKSSVLMPALNTLFLRILSSGLPSFWESQVSLKFQNQKVQLEVKLSSMRHGLTDSDEPVVLKLDHVDGIFMLWTIGIVISTIAFVAEFIIFKCTHKH